MNIIEKFKMLFHSFYFEATAKLADGKEIRIDGDMAIGAKVYLITADGEVPMADGEWSLDNEQTIIVENGEIVDIKEKEDTETSVEESEAETTETEMAAEPETAEQVEPEQVEEPLKDKSELGVEVVDTIKMITDLETKLQELYEKFDSLMYMVNDMGKKVEEKTNEYDQKFSRVKVVEPVKTNNFELPQKRFDSPYIGSYDEYKNSKK